MDSAQASTRPRGRDRSLSLPSAVMDRPAPPQTEAEKPRRLSDLLMNLVSRNRAGSLPEGQRVRRSSHQASVGSTAGTSTAPSGKSLGARRHSFQVNPVDAQVFQTYERLLHEDHATEGSTRFSIGAGSETPLAGRSSNLGLPAPPPLKKSSVEEIDEKKGKQAPEDLTEPSCLICLGKFNQRKPPIQIPCSAKCNLAPVHARCIYEWKEQRAGSAMNPSGSCPLCRAALSSVDYIPPDPLATKTLFMHSARRSFVSRPAPKAAGMVRAYVRVIGSGLVTGTPLRYEMILQAPTTRKYPNVPLPPTYGMAEGDQLLMTARRRTKRSAGSSIIDISLDRAAKDFARNGPNYVADVRGSLSGLDYTITAPCKFEFHRESNQTLELGSIRFEQNRVGSGAGPRRISICLPAVREDPAPMDPWPPSVLDSVNPGKTRDQTEEEEEDDDDDDMINEVYRTMEYVPQNRRESLRRVVRQRPPVSTSPTNLPAATVSHMPPETPAHLMQPHTTTGVAPAPAMGPGFSSDQFIFARNRKPYYLESIAAFSLDFFGRVTLPSNKNCLLTTDDSASSSAGPESNILLFGKIGVKGRNADATVYTLDFQWPLSPLQAFGIALASCDRKFGCA